MAIYRVMAQPHPELSWWPTTASGCFYCARPLVAGALAVTWMSVSGSSYWHVRCAKDWAPAFMRDVWEAAQAAASPLPNPDKATEAAASPPPNPDKATEAAASPPHNPDKATEAHSALQRGQVSD
jgi:hypothetical protein